MFKEKLKGFIAGVCTTVLVVGAVTVFAQNIDVQMGGIKVFWDGVEKTLTNVNGEKVEPMIYEGTTYVPIRAMANLLGKEVNWDQQNLSVYVGGKPTAKTTSIADMERNDSNNIDVSSNPTTFRLKDQEIPCENYIKGNNVWAHVVYSLNGKYTELVGKAVIPYSRVGSDDTGELTFYSVENDGTETVIQRYNLKQSQEPIDININLTGVANLKIQFHDNDSEHIRFYNASFLSE